MSIKSKAARINPERDNLNELRSELSVKLVKVNKNWGKNS